MTGDAPDALESPTVAARAVLLAVGGFLAFAALTGAGLAVYDRRGRVARPVPHSRVPPEPRLQVDPAADLAALRARDAARLSGSGPVEGRAGFVRVPIADAMRIVVARGTAGFDPIEGPAVPPSPARNAPDRPAGAPPR